MTVSIAVTLPGWQRLMAAQCPHGSKPVGIRTVREWARRPDFPRPIDDDRTPPRYRLAELDAWMSRPTAARAA